MESGIKDQKLRPFLSIRWKLFLALGCLVLFIHTVFFVWFFDGQRNSHEQKLASLKFNQLDKLSTLIFSTSNDLFKVAQIFEISFLEGLVDDQVIGQQVNSLFTEKMEKIDSHRAHHHIGKLADRMSIYNKEAEQLNSWGEGEDVAMPIIAESIQQQQVSSGIYCSKACYVYVVSPLSIETQLEGAFVVQAKLSPLLNRFNQLTDVEIGLVTSFPSQANFSTWSESVYSLTHASKNLPLLVQLSSNVAKLQIEEDYLLDAFDNLYLIAFVPSEGIAVADRNWVLISDVTLYSNHFRAVIEDLLIWSLLSLVLSLFALYLIVTRFAQLLPRILAMSQLIGTENEGSKTVSYSSDQKILDDELQQYDRQLAQIHHEMERLKQTDSENTLKLQNMLVELNQAKGFIDRLLNDEHTIILVQQLGGEIIALNQPGCLLFEIEDFAGLTYSEIFCSDLLEEDGLAALNYLYLGGETLVKAEAQWRNKKGDTYTLLWVHSLLCVPGTIDPIILSICVDITEQRKAEERLEWLAFNDPSLTNDNKQLFLEYLPFAITRSLEEHKVLALLYCEVSKIPATVLIGHSDLTARLLEKVVQRISDCLGQNDMLTPLSDEHFVIVLEGLDAISDAAEVIEKVDQSLNSAVQLDQESYHLEITIGVSYAPEHTESVPELLGNAEAAMFKAKRDAQGFSVATTAID